MDRVKRGEKTTTGAGRDDIMCAVCYTNSCEAAIVYMCTILYIYYM